MATSRYEAAKLDDEFDVIIIHGVGNPAMGELVSAATSTLMRASLRGTGTIAECNWNQIVKPSALRGRILVSAWEDLSICLARASAIGEGPSANNRFSRLLRIVSGMALMFAELGLTAALAAFLMALPVLLAVSVLTGIEAILTVGVHAIIVFAWWCTVAGLGALALLVFSGLIRTFVVNAWAPFFVELRRALIFIMRPGLIIGALFFLIPWRKLTDGDWVVIFFKFGPLLSVGMAIEFGLIAYWLGAEDFTWAAVGSSALIFCGLLFSIGIAGLVVTLITVRTFAPSLKIALDIFRYIGNTSYRDKIQSHLNSEIQKLSGDGAKPPKPLFIVSHSLGTVIAIHSLLSSEVWSENARITLITLGSPVRRSFMRFFPGLFFPASITDVAAAIAGRVREFRWINCYRPWDQVGTALGLNGLAYARDLSTHQWNRIWNAHPDYWSDDHVLDTITKAIREIPVHSAVRTQGERPAPRHFVVTEGVDAVESSPSDHLRDLNSRCNWGFVTSTGQRRDRRVVKLLDQAAHSR